MLPIPLPPAVEALNAIRAVDWNVPVFLHVRGLKADDNWLSMGYGEDQVTIGYIVLYVADQIPRALAQFNELMRGFDGRPHWGKWCQNGRAELQKAYPKLGDFLALRERYDPDDIFITQTMRDWLYA